MNKEITIGHEGRLKIKRGIDKGVDAVLPTLGAIGMSAIIEVPGLDPIEADDAVTIIRNLEFKDKYENLGLKKLKKGAIRTSTEGKDGTATTATLIKALTNEAFKEVEKDSSKIREVKERLKIGLVEILEELKKQKRDVSLDEIEKVANTSSLDPEVSKMIAEVISEVGVNGVVTVEKGSKQGYTKEVVKGARFDKGLISPFFINDQENKQTVLEDVYIVLVDRKISTNEQILSLLNSIGTGKDILFIADTVESVALGTLAQNAMSKVADIACVSNPFSGSRARDFLFDMASLTGATVISEEMGMKLDEQTVKVCGRADKVIVTRDTTTIIGGKGSPEIRINTIKGELESSISPYEKGILEDRLAQLTGGIGVIRVGAYTDTEFNEKKLKFDNAINATQASLQEGILPGGGGALARCDVSEPMFRNILTVPFRQMAKNAGMYDEQNFFQRLFRMKKKQDKLVKDIQSYKDCGYDFRTKEFVNMFDRGVIDPFKLLRLALESATNIAYSTIDKEVTITEEDEEKQTKD